MGQEGSGPEERDFLVVPEVIDDNTDGGEDDDSDRKQLQHPAQHLDTVGKDVACQLVGLVVGVAHDANKQDDEGRDEAQTDLPEVHSQPRHPHFHILDVAKEAVEAVAPENGDLDEGDEDDRVGATVVHQVEHQEPGAETAGEAAEKGDETGGDGDVVPVLAKSGEVVDNGGDQRLPGGGDRGEGQERQHEEEHEGEERGQLHLGHRVGVGDEGETSARLDHVLHRHAVPLGQNTEDAKDNEAAEDGGERVGDPDERASR